MTALCTIKAVGKSRCGKQPAESSLPPRVETWDLKMHAFLIVLSMAAAATAVCPSGWIALGQNENCNIFPGGTEPLCSGNFGTIYATNCGVIDIKKGAEDDDWCGSGYLSGSTASCSNHGKPSSVTLQDGSHWGNCQKAATTDTCTAFSGLGYINGPIYYCCQRQ